MSKNHTSKQETVGEAIRDIAHHEHNFALADNSTNHLVISLFMAPFIFLHFYFLYLV